jgi:N-acetylglucosaminyl-diphospho-decaprenol L-rhamnosyltransferase
MTQTRPTCSIIIVTHNSQQCIQKAIVCIKKQTWQPDKIVLVDSGSTSVKYLESYASDPGIVLVLAKGDIGFCKGNNLGWSAVSCSSDYVFFLNPDAFIQEDYLEKAIQFMQHPVNQQCAAVTGVTLGYDLQANTPTGKYDSTGVFQKWYGGWFDRGQGKEVNANLYKESEEIPAICGAVFFCRSKALKEVIINEKEIFDNNFYMYKEDIDLSMRLRKKGWTLLFVPDLIAYHCRGWNRNRRRMPRKMRLCSARNELSINMRKPSPIGVVYSSLKYTAVKVLDI